MNPLRRKQIQQKQEQSHQREMKMLDVIADSPTISLHDLKPIIRDIYSIPDITLQSVDCSWFTEPIAVLRHWQIEGILHVVDWDNRLDRERIEINCDNWSLMSMRFQLTDRGLKFHESREVPVSKYAQKRTKKVKNKSDTQDDIATQVIRKRKKFREPENIERAREKIAQAIATRQGQEKFRQELIRTYGSMCLITGPNIQDILEAAHIKPYSEGGTFNISNGLLLRADIHTLFDLGLIAIDAKNFTVIASSKLIDTPYQGLSGQKLHLPVGSENLLDTEALDLHRTLANL